MALIEKALDYIIGIVTENEEVRKFPKDFVTASMKWIRSWFLTDDPKTEAKLADPNRSIESKKTIIESKLEDLHENPQFVKELTEQLKGFDQQKARLKNVVTNADIDVKGNVHIGDKGNSSGDNYDEKNVVKGGTIKAGGDFRLGDDVVSGNQNVQIVHHHYNNQKAAENTPPQYSSLKTQLQQLIKKEKIEEALELFMDEAEEQKLDCLDELFLLSARFNRTEKNERKRIITTAEADTERNRINDALTTLIKDLE
jgi:Effector-associated domain 11